MTEPAPETPNPAPEPETPNPAPPDQSEHASDQDQGVGVAPTEPGDAGEGNPGTHFESTEQIEEKLGRTVNEGATE